MHDVPNAKKKKKRLNRINLEFMVTFNTEDMFSNISPPIIGKSKEGKCHMKIRVFTVVCYIIY